MLWLEKSYYCGHPSISLQKRLLWTPKHIPAKTTTADTKHIPAKTATADVQAYPCKNDYYPCKNDYCGHPSISLQKRLLRTPKHIPAKTTTADIQAYPCKNFPDMLKPSYWYPSLSGIITSNCPFNLNMSYPNVNSFFLLVWKTL